MSSPFLDRSPTARKQTAAGGGDQRIAKAQLFSVLWPPVHPLVALDHLLQLLFRDGGMLMLEANYLF